MIHINLDIVPLVKKINTTRTVRLGHIATTLCGTKLTFYDSNDRLIHSKPSEFFWAQSLTLEIVTTICNTILTFDIEAKVHKSYHISIIKQYKSKIDCPKCLELYTLYEIKELNNDSY